MRMRETANQLFASTSASDANLRRLLDILCAGVAASVLMPVLLITASAIWIGGGDPRASPMHGQPTRHADRLSRNISGIVTEQECDHARIVIRLSKTP
jgi:hypothetical protein